MPESGGHVAEETGGNGRSFARIGGWLVAAGAWSWILHSMLLWFAATLLVQVSMSSPSSAQVQPGFLILGAAAGAAAGAGLAFGTGLLLHSMGLFRPPGAPEPRRAGSSWSLALAAVAAIGFIGYGILAIVGLVDVLATRVRAPGMAFPEILDFAARAVVVWFAASCLLVAAAILTNLYLRGLRGDAQVQGTLSARDLIPYAVLNAVGVGLLVAAILPIAAAETLNMGQALSVLVLLGQTEFVAVPILGIITFGFVFVVGLRLRQAVPR